MLRCKLLCFRLKDSDVTWLYGPLHTAVEAVPPPRVATASERLGLDPLRSLSDSKQMRGKKPPIITKPILKYRSLSDILLPPGMPASPVLEHTGMEFEDDSSTHTIVQHARSDSNLVRLINSRKSPLGSPRELSPDRAHASDSSTSTSSTRYNGDRRHISFNHRVEQCIAVDSTEEAKKYPGSGENSDEDDGDDEEEVLTFKSSARITSFGPSSSTYSSHPKHSSGREPHTIARLGPTTLKSTELYPHPSPAVVYQNEPESSKSTILTYSSRPPTSSQPPSPGTAAEAGRRAMYAAYSAGATGSGGSGNQIGWNADDEEVEYAMGFDYFTGPDVGVGDEYDMAQYGSTHLVGGSHNGYQGGAPTAYLPNGPYAPESSYNVSSSNSTTPSGSNDTSPDHSRHSSVNSKSPTSSNSSSNSSSTSTIVGMRGPHSPATTSKDAQPPKRSILKNHRSHSSSGASFDDSNPSSVPPSPTSSSGSSGARFGSHVTSSPNGSNSPSPASSPYSSATSLAAVMQSAGIPSRNSAPSGVRRINSEEVVREGRGRSTSRGSSASLERSASADRRPSSSGTSVSPSSSYSPPSNLGPGGNSGARPIGIANRGRSGSSDSLSSMGAAGNLAGGREVMPDLVEASSESETETLRPSIDEVIEEEEAIKSADVVLLSRSPGKSGIGGVLERNSVELPSTTTPTPIKSTETIPTLPISFPTPSPASSTSAAILIAPPLIPHVPIVKSTSSSLSNALASSQPTHPSLPARYRQPSPSSATTLVDDDTATAISRVNSNGESGAAASLSNSPALDPIDLASTQWSDENPVPSYARRSLLRAARGGSSSSHHGIYGSDRTGNGENSSTSSLDRVASNSGNSMKGSIGSIDSGIGPSDDYGFGSSYYDEVLEGGTSEGGLVGRTLEVAATTRDLLGATFKGLWAFGSRRSS